MTAPAALLTKPEELLRACLAHLIDPEQPLPEAHADVAVEYLPALAARNRVEGLLYALGRDHPGLWLSGAQSRLKAGYEAARLWGVLAGSEVGAALEALQRAGIPTLVLKGWALVPTLYRGDPGLRMCGDLDLLLHPRDAGRAEVVLSGLGYRAPLEPWPGFDRRYRFARAFRRPRQPWPFADLFAVALHWSLFDTPYYFCRINLDALFDRSRPLRVAGVEARALCPEDHLAYACGHLALHHDYDPALARYYELAALIWQARAELDWPAVAERLAEWRLVLAGQHVLGRLSGLFPGVIPATASERLSSLRPVRSECLVHAWVVRYRQNHAARALLLWLTLTGVLRRGRYLFEAAFPNSAYLAQRYGPAPLGLWPLHYFRRAVLALTYSARLAVPHPPEEQAPSRPPDPT